MRQHGPCPKYPKVFEDRQLRSAARVSTYGTPGAERGSNLGLEILDALNPFSLFDGALVPSEIVRSLELVLSEDLVFDRPMQFAGGNGREWPFRSVRLQSSPFDLSANV